MITMLLAFTLSAHAAEAPSCKVDFKKAFAGKDGAGCDAELKKLDETLGPRCDNMGWRDFEVDAWAHCWEQSLNRALDRRLLPLQKSAPPQFKAEMALQKEFNTAVNKLCHQVCDNGMRGISTHFCEVGARKYRLRQASLVEAHKLSLSAPAPAGENARKKKEKKTILFNAFGEALCRLPADLWEKPIPKSDCEKAVADQLNGYEFTDDPCDLS